MEITMKYIIKDVGFTSLDKEYNILDSIRKKNESLVFYRCDTKIHELSEEAYNNLKEEYFEGYCNDTIGLSLEEHLQIKLLIINFLVKNKLLQYMQPIGISQADEYYKNMVDNCFDMYHYNFVDKIKDIIMNIAYGSESPYRKNFINKRILYHNNYYLDEEGINKVVFTNIWYMPNDVAEILYAMKEEAIYSGIITDSSNPFDYSATSFCKVETADNYDLYISTKDNEKLNTNTWNIIEAYKWKILIV